jgi:hypothetical protein
MKQIIPGMVLLFLMFTGAAQAKDIRDYKKKPFQFIIHTSLSPLTFELLIDPESRSTRIIKIRQQGSTKTRQTIQVKDNEGAPCADCEFFWTTDINFDGYKDLKLINWWGVTGNTAYHFWLYNPSTGKFDYHEKLSNLSNPKVNTKTKTIHTFSRGGHAGMIHTSGTYVYSNGKLIQTGSYSQDWDKQSGRYKYVRMKRIKGKLIVTKKGTVKEN